ncbi:MAG: PD40 domain-containing protein [Solirubrobacteraceae bacterium]|nr:PD40 domain-containing protein [Solirubrobacteraceae bacterium]
MRRLLTASSIAITALACGAAPAHAGLNVALTASPVGQTGAGNLDILFVNPFPQALQIVGSNKVPTGVNTASSEIDPTLSDDGTRLAFRRELGAGEPTYHAVTVPSGSPVALPNPLSTSRFNSANGIALSGDGKRAIVGIARNSSRVAQVGVLDLAQFPGGPFPTIGTPEFDIPDGNTFGEFGLITSFGAQLDATGGKFLYGYRTQTAGTLTAFHGLVDGPVNGTPRVRDLGSTAPISGIAMVPGRPNEATIARQGNLETVALNATTPPTPLSLPNLPARGAATRTAPDWSGDGRYLAWLSFSGTGELKDLKLFVYDTQTQGLIAPEGLSLGQRRNFGGVSIAEGVAAIQQFTAPVSVQLEQPKVNLPIRLQASISVGILVQREQGTVKVLGKRVPKLVPVGRVPFGKQKKGRTTIAWNGKVAGKQLRAGRYRITLRAFDKKGKLTELGASRRVTVRP